MYLKAIIKASCIENIELPDTFTSRPLVHTTQEQFMRKLNCLNLSQTFPDSEVHSLNPRLYMGKFVLCYSFAIYKLKKLHSSKEVPRNAKSLLMKLNNKINQ